TGEGAIDLEHPQSENGTGFGPSTARAGSCIRALVERRIAPPEWAMEPSSVCHRSRSSGERISRDCARACGAVIDPAEAFFTYLRFKLPATHRIRFVPLDRKSVV